MPSSHPRSRYIAFQISLCDSQKDPQFTRNDIIHTIQDQCIKRFQTPCKTFDIYLTRFQHSKGIVRCYHTEKERTTQLLQDITKIQSVNVHIETLGASGTIKRCCKKYFMGDPLQ